MEENKDLAVVGFLSTLFDEGEEVCVSHNEYGYKSVPQSALFDSELTLHSNQKDKTYLIRPEEINLVSINAIKGARNDSNVTTLRSFLVEIDTMALDKQMSYVEEKQMPYSVAVFSGNKSIHFGITVDEPYESLSVWKFVNKWILNIMSEADQQTLNPSRSIRFPNNLRNNGKKLKQYLIKNNGRIKKEVLNIWLNKHPDKQPKIEKPRQPKGRLLNINNIPSWVKHFYDNGVTTERNKTWFSIACWFAEHGNIDEETFMDIWSNVFNEEFDFSRREWEITIKSAFKRMQG